MTIYYHNKREVWIARASEGTFLQQCNNLYLLMRWLISSGYSLWGLKIRPSYTPNHIEEGPKL